MFLIMGITGQVGGAAARRLLDLGCAVRALVRDPDRAADWAARGVELRAGDMADPDAVAAALAGVEGAFLMLPPAIGPAPGFPEVRAKVAAYAEAVRRAPPPRLALLSSAGSERDRGVGLIESSRLLELGLAEQPFPVAVIRAGGFIENSLPALARAAETGFLDGFLSPTDRAVPMTASQDIGAEIARLLVEGWEGRRLVEIGSRLSPDDLARAATSALGRPVQARAIPRARWTAVIESFGAAPGTTGPYEEMMDAFCSGWMDFGVEGAVQVPGTLAPETVFSRALRP